MRLVSFVGPSGVGKTTLITRLIERLSRQGLRIGALKHAHAHDVEMDREGKDTFRFSSAGACAVGIASNSVRAVIVKTGRPTSLAELAAMLPGDLDLVLVEGYKSEDVPKIEVHRRGHPLLAAEGLPGVFAVVTDDDSVATMPRFAHEDLDGIVALLLGGERRAAYPSFTRRTGES